MRNGHGLPEEQESVEPILREYDAQDSGHDHDGSPVVEARPERTVCRDRVRSATFPL